MSTSRNKVIVIIIAVIAAIAVAAGITLKSKPTLINSNPLPKAVSIDTTGQPTLGNPGAPLHFVVFEDLKCGNCKNYNNHLFPKIKKEYIDTEKAEYSVILLAFINGSISAANAALCLDDQNTTYFFPYIDYLYQNQPPETEDWTTIAHLLVAASKATPRADRDKLSNCIFESRYTDKVHDNLLQAEKLMNKAVATPSLYINGIMVRPLTMDRIKEVIKHVSP